MQIGRAMCSTNGTSLPRRSSCRLGTWLSITPCSRHSTLGWKHSPPPPPPPPPISQRQVRTKEGTHDLALRQLLTLYRHGVSNTIRTSTVAAARLDFLCPASVTKVTLDSGVDYDWPELTLSSAGKEDRKIRCRLLVAADGANSPIRQMCHMTTWGWEYDQRALVATVKLQDGGGEGKPSLLDCFILLLFIRVKYRVLSCHVLSCRVILRH